jgi:hypothetical protein
MERGYFRQRRQISVCLRRLFPAGVHTLRVLPLCDNFLHKVSENEYYLNKKILKTEIPTKKWKNRLKIKKNIKIY